MRQKPIPNPRFSSFALEVFEEGRVSPQIVLVFDKLVVVVFDRIDMLIHKARKTRFHFQYFVARSKAHVTISFFFDASSRRRLHASGCQPPSALLAVACGTASRPIHSACSSYSFASPDGQSKSPTTSEEPAQAKRSRSSSTCSGVPVQIGRGVHWASGSFAEVRRIETAANLEKLAGPRPATAHIVFPLNTYFSITASTLPTFTAREKPKVGSNGEPEEIFCRVAISYSFCHLADVPGTASRRVNRPVACQTLIPERSGGFL